MNKVYKFALLLSAFMALFFMSCDDDFWELSKYTVSYYTKKGTAPASIELEYGTKLSASHLPTLTATGWDFEGWFLSTDKSKQEILPDTYEVKGNITLCALWSRNGDDKNEITATTDSGGGVTGNSDSGGSGSGGSGSGESGGSTTDNLGGLIILIQ